MSDPAPFTPAECDLRGMPYMPLYVSQLLDSDFYALSTGDEFKAGLTLWAKAFMQIPAGSLPDDDRLLAHLSGAGANWPVVKAMALHGWVKCSDGRLYHRTVAERVLDAWRCRLERRARTEAARAAKQAKRAPAAADIQPPPSVTDTVTTSVTDTVTGSKGTEQNRTVSKEERTKLRLASPSGVAGPRDLVWSEGLTIIRDLTGRPIGSAKGLLGELLTLTSQDAARVLALLREAAADRPADASSWLIAGAKRAPGRRYRNGIFEVIAEEGSGRADDDDEPNRFLSLPGYGHATH